MSGGEVLCVSHSLGFWLWTLGCILRSSITRCPRGRHGTANKRGRFCNDVTMQLCWCVADVVCTNRDVDLHRCSAHLLKPSLHRIHLGFPCALIKTTFIPSVYILWEFSLTNISMCRYFVSQKQEKSSFYFFFCLLFFRKRVLKHKTLEICP